MQLNLDFLLQITYDSVGPIQMRFLRLLSSAARQNFTYTCINSVVWYDALSRNYQKSITFLGDNEEEFSSARNKPNVPHDGCRVRHRFESRPNLRRWPDLVTSEPHIEMSLASSGGKF